MKGKKLKKILRQKNGITLIALVITIIVLLILAGVSIAMLTGNNGILNQASNAKENTEIATEKEIIGRARLEAFSNNWVENMTEQEFQTALDSQAGGRKAIATNIGEEFEVYFIESERYYIVDKNGNIEEEKIVEVADLYPGDITTDDKGNALTGDSEEEAYQINSIEDLVAFSNIINKTGVYYKEGQLLEAKDAEDISEKYVELTTDLDFNSKTSYMDSERTDFGDINGNDKDGNALITEMTEGTGYPVIGLNTEFKGTFEGNNNKIKNLYINNSTSNRTGFFGTNSGEVRNMIVSGKIKSSSSNVGGVVSNNSGTIENVESQMEFELENRSVNLGGIVANNNNAGIIKNCRNTRNINITSAYALGGICAQHIGEAEIEDCYNTGNIIIENATMIGGIVGNSSSITATINKCYNTGNINISSSVGYVGGIKGNGANSGIVVNCYNSGNIDVNDCTGAGGIAGYHKYGVVGNCYNTGDITATGSRVNLIGGIVGDQTVSCRIANCYNTGDISVKSTTTSAPGIGGISGINYSGGAILKNVTNFGKLSIVAQNQNKIGGIAGTSYSTITNAKYLENTWIKGAGNKQDAVGVMETCTLDYIPEMLETLNVEQIVIGDYTLPENVRFTKWKIENNKNDGFPIFEWQ